ncbi:MAG: polyphosphate kinase 1 [Gemmatimonadaceae bacterium]
MTHPPLFFRFEIRSARHLEELAKLPLPLGLGDGAPKASRHRDLYLDTPEDHLRRRNVTCRLRLCADDTRLLSVRIGAGAGGSEERFDSAVKSAEVQAALAENTATGRRLRALVDPGLLVVRLEIQTERTTRKADRDWLGRHRLEVHYDRSTGKRDGRSSTFYHVCLHASRCDGATAARLAEAFETAHTLRRSAMTPREEAELLLRWKKGPSDAAAPAAMQGIEPAAAAGFRAQFLNPELSLLAFQSRVLALAEDPGTPLRERLRFLGIVSSNIDEFFMIRVAGLRQMAQEQSDEQCDDGLSRGEQLRLISGAVEDLARRQSACARECLTALEEAEVRIFAWGDLNPAQRQDLRQQCIDQIHPDLTPMAMTLSPGHPLPHLPHLTLALAIARRDPHTRRLHLAELELPSDAPRFFRVPGETSGFITLEEIVRSNIDLVHPLGGTEGVYAFRVTRGGELTLDEEAADDLIEAVAHASGRRTANPAVRIEVEHGMPGYVRDLLLENLKREDPSIQLDSADIQDVDGLLDLACLSRLEIPDTAGAGYPRFDPAEPALSGESMFDAMREGDLLFHHPFDSFAATVTGFLREASEDPDVTTIRITLYRLGSSSDIADALIRAAKNGKKVVAFVELKARFDEDQNVGWARKLEKAGGHVVSGLVGYKNHAKVAMVVRREGERLRSYVHVGTGNYNARSGREYTDFSLFSARDDLVQDATDLFNALTGGTLPPRGLSRGSLVAPHQMADSLIGFIDREAANARAGLPSGIILKVNGLSDSDVILALLRAAGDGVRVDIICRGICTLRPGIAGVSANVRVVSNVGRFLEHSRAYRFENGGDPVHFIGSADLRQRNLRRRVELLVPITRPEQKAEIDRILRAYLDDRAAWELREDGSYVQRRGGPSDAQMLMMG